MLCRVPPLVGDARAAGPELDRRTALANEALDRVAAGGPMRVARARRVTTEE